MPSTPRDADTGVSTPPPITKELASKTTCIVCKKPARASSIYCSDACILKHAQDSLGSHSPSTKADSKEKLPEKPYSESRVCRHSPLHGHTFFVLIIFCDYLLSYCANVF